jgi:hypothetical protein
MDFWVDWDLGFDIAPICGGVEFISCSVFITTWRGMGFFETTRGGGCK